MEFEQLRGQYQRALYHLVTVARASTGCESALQVPKYIIFKVNYKNKYCIHLNNDIILAYLFCIAY